MATGVCEGAGAWRLLMDQVDRMDQMDKMGAPRYTPWVCMPQCGLARAKSYRWVKQCADLPQGYAGQLDGNGGMQSARA